MGSIVLIGVVAVLAVVMVSDLLVTERRRRRSLRSYFVPQDPESPFDSGHAAHLPRR